jgi:hypothetical protein
MARHLTLALLATVVTVSGCIGVSVDGDPGPGRGHGPPPHAPAHGYRHKHHGTELGFDAKLGVYVVIGLPHHYFDHGRFLRLRAGSWEVGASLDGPWHAYSSSSVPASLRNASLDEGKPGKPPGQAPAKGRW